jgi:hypothetical protein
MPVMMHPMLLDAIKSAVLSKAPNPAAYRSEAARLRAVMSEVEAAVAAGITHEAILATLNESGVRLELTGFRSALARARKAGAKKQHREDQPSQQPTKGGPGQSQPGTTQIGKFQIPTKPTFTHNPSPDDDILS